MAPRPSPLDDPHMHSIVTTGQERMPGQTVPQDPQPPLRAFSGRYPSRAALSDGAKWQHFAAGGSRGYGSIGCVDAALWPWSEFPWERDTVLLFHKASGERVSTVGYTTPQSFVASSNNVSQ